MCGCNFEFHVRTNGKRNPGNEAAFERGFDLEGDWTVHCGIVINRTKLGMCFVLFLSHLPLQYKAIFLKT